MGKNVEYFNCDKTEEQVKEIYGVIEELNKIIKHFSPQP